MISESTVAKTGRLTHISGSCTVSSLGRCTYARQDLRGPGGALSAFAGAASAGDIADGLTLMPELDGAGAAAGGAPGARGVTLAVAFAASAPAMATCAPSRSFS